MVTADTRVDVLSLESFLVTIGARLDEARSMVTKLTFDVAGTPPKLGTFTDGTTTAGTYRTVRTQQLARAQRLVAALEAAYTATSSIITSYRTTEQRNHANVADIAGRLGDVAGALTEEV